MKKCGLRVKMYIYAFPPIGHILLTSVSCTVVFSINPLPISSFRST